MIFNNRFVILIVNYRTFVAHDLTLVPFTERFRVLRLSRNHVIQGSRLAVAVFTQLGIRMVCIVEYLIFRSRDIRGLSFDFLDHIQYAGVRTFTYFPFEFKFIVFEFVSENQVATIFSTSFTCSGSFDMDRTVYHFPGSRHIRTIVASPSIERFTVEQSDFAIGIFRESRQVDSRQIVHEFVFRNGSFCLCLFCRSSSFFCFFTTATRCEIAHHNCGTC